jgi:hypothetical protein
MVDTVEVLALGSQLVIFGLICLTTLNDRVISKWHMGGMHQPRSRPLKPSSWTLTVEMEAGVVEARYKRFLIIRLKYLADLEGWLRWP